MNGASARHVGGVSGTVTCSAESCLLGEQVSSARTSHPRLGRFCTECSELEPLEYHDHQSTEIRGEEKNKCFRLSTKAKHYRLVVSNKE
jgi:hypothetical protein